MNIEKIYLGHANGKLSWALLRVDAPIGWWADFASYNIGEIVEQRIIRYRIIKKPFSWDDFDADMIINYGGSIGEGVGPDYRYAHAMLMATIIESLNAARDRYLNYESRGPGWEHASNMAWEQIIGLLPQSYIIRKDLSLDSDDIAKILSYSKGVRHWDDLQKFLIEHGEKKV